MPAARFPPPPDFLSSGPQEGPPLTASPRVAGAGRGAGLRDLRDVGGGPALVVAPLLGVGGHRELVGRVGLTGVRDLLARGGHLGIRVVAAGIRIREATLQRLRRVLVGAGSARQSPLDELRVLIGLIAAGSGDVLAGVVVGDGGRLDVVGHGRDGRLVVVDGGRGGDGLGRVLRGGRLLRRHEEAEDDGDEQQSERQLRVAQRHWVAPF